MRFFEARRELRKMGLTFREVVGAARSVAKRGDEVNSVEIAVELIDGESLVFDRPEFDWDSFLELLMAILPLILKLFGL